MDRWPSGSVRIPLCNCPHCGHIIDATDEMSHGDAVPGPDDWGVCVYCGGLLQYNDDLTLRRGSVMELAREPAEVRLRIMQMQRAARLGER